MSVETVQAIILSIVVALSLFFITSVNMAGAIGILVLSASTFFIWQTLHSDHVQEK
ncbi:nitrate reductase NapE component [Alkalihalobacillus xiaoxiensis]|uniref:Nitrate reductase NapE component n=1 Tax=Shouchella xiaoxiensis TaxID=766895 RepID=A0ABS2SWR3_9BACI|nr:hypothetical protein [Shouchella xiaoxiensis]MBM7839938.1 nitrate reductase NapE component [Shouchella xiaoxiensis]